MSQVSVIHLSVAMLFFAATLGASPLVSLNILVYEKVGLSGFAAFWRHHTRRWVLAVRGITALLGALFLLWGLRVL